MRNIKSFEDDKLCLVFRNVNNNNLNEILKRFCTENKKIGIFRIYIKHMEYI